MILRLHVKPNSKLDHIEKLEDGVYKVKIKALPIDGKANAYLVKYLSSILGIPKSSIVLLKGSTSQFKKVALHGDEESLKLILEGF